VFLMAIQKLNANKRLPAPLHAGLISGQESTLERYDQSPGNDRIAPAAPKDRIAINIDRNLA